jgi:hypothetical protein
MVCTSYLITNAILDPAVIQVEPWPVYHIDLCEVTKMRFYFVDNSKIGNSNLKLVLLNIFNGISGPLMSQ